MHSTMFSRRLWNRDFVLVLLISTLASYPNSIFISLLPVYVLDLGGTNALTGLMMTGLTVLGMVTRVIVAPLIDRLGRKKLLVLGSGLYALNAVLFCFTKDLNTLFFLRVLCGFTQGVFFPVPPTMVSDIAPEDLMVDAIGFFGVSSSVTFAVAPHDRALGLQYLRRGGYVPFRCCAGADCLYAVLLCPGSLSPPGKQGRRKEAGAGEDRLRAEGKPFGPDFAALRRESFCLDE